MTTVADDVRRMIKFALGEEWGDGYIVSDISHEYVEPGYHSENGIVVFGNWNDKSTYDPETQTRTVTSTLPSRLFDKLEKLGANCEWGDEWVMCGDCQRAFRSQPDSYGWTMNGTFVENACEYICSECLLEQFDLTDYVNNPNDAITWAKSTDLVSHGWVQWAPDDPQTYESGFHPGQTDDPTTIFANIHEDNPMLDVVFLIDSVGQFDMRFSAYTQNSEDN